MPTVLASSSAFVFGSQVEGGASPELAAVLGGEDGTALDEWCACVGDPALADAVRGFVHSGKIRKPWLQSALTAVQIALAAALRRRGLEPAAVVGLSMGELAAAVVSGRLDIGDATRVARGVSVLFAASNGDGRMAVVATTRTCLARMLGANGPALAITLAPQMQVIAGRCADIERVSGILHATGVEVHGLHVPNAFHSAIVEVLRESFLHQLGGLEPHAGRARFYSGIDASRSPPLTAAHWWDVCRRSFHFDDAIRAMLADGVRWFIEIGARSVVTDYILAIAADLGVRVRVDSAQALLGSIDAPSCARRRPSAQSSSPLVGRRL